MSLRKKILLAVLALLLLLPTAGLYFVASTASGLRFVARQLEGTRGSITLNIGAVEGTLADGFKVESLHVQHRRADVQVAGVVGKIRLWPLLTRRHVSLESLEIRSAAVQLLRDNDDSEPTGAFRFLPATLSVDADSVQVGSVGLTLISGRTLQATAAAGALQILPSRISITGGRMDWQGMHLAATGRVLAARPVGLEGKGAIDWEPEGQPAWHFDTEFDGDLNELPLTVDISRPFHAQVKGAATTLNSDWKITGQGSTRDLDIDVFGAGDALGIITADLALTVDADGFTAKGPVTAPGLQAGPLQLDFNGFYDDKRLTIRHARVLHQPSGSRGNVHGTVDVVSPGPRVALAGEWSPLQWPLAAKEPAFTSPHGTFRLEGIKPWKVQAEGEVNAAGYTGMPATLAGRLGSESLTIEKATVGVLGGSAGVSGEARWNPAESWRVAGRMEGLDPARIREGVTGKLDFDFTASGAPFGEAGTIDFAMSRLTGKLRGQPATGGGRFIKPGGSEDWQFHDVDLRLGRTQIQLDGSLAAPRDLKFALDADDLSLFHDGARGRVSARGRYAGSDAAPLLLFKARGSDFEWQGYRVEEFEADVDVDLTDAGHARGKVDLNRIHLDARTVNRATLELTGTGKAPRFSLDIDAAPLRTALVADGVIEQGMWRGTVQNLSVNDGGELALRLAEPAPLAFNLDELDLRQLCLTDTRARGCGTARLDAAGNWSTVFSAESMPLRAFTAGLSQDVDYEGTINLKGQLAGSKGVVPTGSVRGQLMQALLRHRLSNGREETLSIGTGSVNADATATDFTLQVALDAGAQGNINSEIKGQRNTADWHDYPIRGQLDARTDALSLLDVYVGGIDKASGQLSTRVDIKGTLGNPELAGELQLRDASIDIYQVNLALRDLSFDARFDSTTLDMSGQSRLGPGTARFNGKLSWRDGEPFGDLHVEGERLRIVDVPEARIDASPKLDFKLNGHHIDATGEVLIPSARLEPADLTNAVLASGDETFVNAPPEDPNLRWAVTSNIRLVLGDAVNLDALGLTAKLGGDLTVRTDETQVSRGQGELNITEGKYMALGRLLDIDRGRLLFQNVPLNDPAVDLRAQKEFPDVTAGVNVRGPLRTPRLTFYSEPQLSQSQIASLILAGGSLESVQDATQPGAARNEMLAQGGAILAQRVGSHVGVDDVGIESDPLDSNTSLVLGKYLSPRLYISYGISLAEAINTLKLRYTIGDRWTIKTEAGQARSADIVYTLKRK